MTPEGNMQLPEQREGERSPIFVSIKDLSRLCGLPEQIIANKINLVLLDANRAEDANIVHADQETGEVTYTASTLAEALRSATRRYTNRKKRHQDQELRGSMRAALTRLEAVPAPARTETGAAPDARDEGLATPLTFPLTHTSPEPDDTHMFHDEERQPVRHELETVYTNIEQALKRHAKGELTSDEIACQLGELTSDMPSEETLRAFGVSDNVALHSRRLQILAFDSLVRSLDTLKPGDTQACDLITFEMIYQIAMTEIPEKRAYLTGILMHHLDTALASEDVAGQRNGVGTLAVLGAAKRLTGVCGQLTSPDQEGNPFMRCCTDIMNGFAVPQVEHEHMTEHEQELEAARLIGALYDDPRSVMDVDLGTRIEIQDTPEGAHSASVLIDGVPKAFVILREGYVPGDQKLLEAIRTGWGLGPVFVFKERDGVSRKASVLYCPTNDPVMQKLLRAMRQAKDMKDLRTCKTVMDQIKQHALSSLDGRTAQMVQGKIDRGCPLEVKLLTIRDTSPVVH